MKSTTRRLTAAIAGTGSATCSEPMSSVVRRPKASAGSDCGRATTIGIPSFTVRGISRSDGMKTSGVRPSTASTSDWLMPTRLCARFRSR